MIKKEFPNVSARIRKLTFSSSPWFEKIKTDKIWLCESVGKLKGIVNQGEVKMNEINTHTIANLQRYVLIIWVAQVANSRLSPNL